MGRRPVWALIGCTMGAALLARCDGGVIVDPTAPLDMATNAQVAQALRVVPGNQVLLVDLNQEARLTFQVNVVFSDGSTRDVTSQVQLSSSNAAVGRLSAATFIAPAQAQSKVDFTTITATYQVGGATLKAQANLTVVWLRQSGPAQDFFFVLPFNGAAQQKPLSFGTQVQSIDAFFAVDTTNSMVGAITQLRDSLQQVIIPGVSAAAPRGAWFGVGAVEDFPVAPYGDANVRVPPVGIDDQPFILLGPMTSDVAAARTAVGNLLVGQATRGRGGDLPEAHLEALYQIATGAGNVVPGVVNVPKGSGKGVGGVELRSGALPVVTLITDAAFHTKGEPARNCSLTTTTGITVNQAVGLAEPVLTPAHSRDEALGALNKICARVVGVSVLRTHIDGYVDQPAGICNATDDLTRAAVGTGAVVPPQAWDLPARPANCAAGKCCTGLAGGGEEPNAQGLCPLVFKLPQDGSGLGGQVTSGISQVARYGTFEVITSVSGGSSGDAGAKLPAGKTTADFVKAVRPLDSMAPPAPPTIKAPVIAADRFTGVSPGSTVRFSIDARNDFQPQLDHPQVFRANIKVLAGGCTDLDQRDVLILVPPAEPVLG